MGYHTDFAGSFKLNKPADAETRAVLAAIYDDPKNADGGPGYYCQWQLTDDGEEIEWDQGEKFYGYIEWAEYLQKLLADRGYEMTGVVEWRGENFEDNGTMIAKDGKIEIHPIGFDEDQAEAANKIDAILKRTYAALLLLQQGKRDGATMGEASICCDLIGKLINTK
jgi:hypothetical protein